VNGAPTPHRSRMIRPVLPLLAALSLAATPVPPMAAAGLVDAGVRLPGTVLDIRYATADNFTGRPLYPLARCLLRTEVADRLALAAGGRRRQGVRRGVLDCYRPRHVQRELWKAMPRRGWVADPANGSHHNRAAAVDLSLADLSGTPVEMPTGYDAFGPRARAWATEGVSRTARRHRDALRVAMTTAGFTVNPMEWWHFDAPGAAALPLLDLPIDVPSDGPSHGPICPSAVTRP
jgi:D-alanyl-D-alanine dipeptidase